MNIWNFIKPERNVLLVSHQFCSVNIRKRSWFSAFTPNLDLRMLISISVSLRLRVCVFIGAAPVATPHRFYMMSRMLPIASSRQDSSQDQGSQPTSPKQMTRWLVPTLLLPNILISRKFVSGDRAGYRTQNFECEQECLNRILTIKQTLMSHPETRLWGVILFGSVHSNDIHIK